MDIRNVTAGTMIRTREDKYDGPRVLIINDNYWNRRSRHAYEPVGYKNVMIYTIDIDQASTGCLNGERVWEQVFLTKAQVRQRNAQRHLEYVTSPESETYWCS